jgi:hypothetical protein
MPFPRGLRPTPRHRLAAAFPFRPATAQVKALPSFFGTLPKQLLMWGNDTYGDCVTAEEMFKLACYSVQCGLPEICPSNDDAIAWARQEGVLNGADLEPVIQQMQSTGITINGVNYKDGAPLSVDYTNDDTLRAAIAQGPIKIGVSADPFNGVAGVGQTNAWVMTGFSQDSNEDHCTSLCGFGQAGDLFKSVLNASLPANSVAGDTIGYLMFTWSTVGFIDKPSLLAICGEAWLRTPSTVGQTPPAPTTTPTPVPPAPTPTPSSTTFTLDLGKLTYSPAVDGYTIVPNNLNEQTVVAPGRKLIEIGKGWTPA